MTRATRNIFTWNTDAQVLYERASIMFNTYLVTECSPYIRGLQIIVDEIFGRWGFDPYVFDAGKVLNRMTAVTPEVIASELENLSIDQLAVLNQYVNPILRYMRSDYGNFIDIFNGISYKTILEDIQCAYKHLEEFIYNE